MKLPKAKIIDYHMASDDEGWFLVHVEGFGNVKILLEAWSNPSIHCLSVSSPNTREEHIRLGFEGSDAAHRVVREYLGWSVPPIEDEEE